MLRLYLQLKAIACVRLLFVASVFPLYMYNLLEILALEE